MPKYVPYVPPPRRNPQLLKSLLSDFVQLYAVTTSYGNIVSINLGLPGLRAYWTTSSIDENMYVYDISGQNRTLSCVEID
jgi:hypothetical protein